MKKAIFCLMCVLGLGYKGAGGDLTLWYSQPAHQPMNEALAIGNGRMGGLIMGDPQRERLIINEDSLWTGNENPSGIYELMGAYQFLGNFLINLAPLKRVTNYRRDLDIATALAHVSFKANGVEYQREFFCSRPAGLLVARLTANRPGCYTGSLELRDAHRGRIIAEANRITVSGALNNGLEYEWQVVALPDGGSIQINGSKLQFNGCNALTFLLAAGTDYAMDYANHYRAAAPDPLLTARLEAAAQRSYDDLKAEHVRDFQSIFNRVALDLGGSSDAQRALPTDRRKLEAAQVFDPELEALLFQYGRYLLISCSRPGGLPANLQGLWNDSNDPPWHSDYHANINVEMNYWPAEVGNMPECHLPFFDLIQSQIPAWRKATAASTELKTPSGSLTTRGWALRTSHNITGGMGWKWDKTANAWYCHHFWEHYAFTGDNVFLQNIAYPVMKET
ncbi:MAG: glycoside hydrolase family 95 protein, partial [Candidatus Omnitrophica bacterium]|nr:glycoside hydrolase family 95 protein [Candidatus Omnitrophota bacterium]